NNAYCQDNEVSWLDWQDVDVDLLAYTTGLLALRRGHPVFRRRRFFHGRPLRGSGVGDIGWLTPDGVEMANEDWHGGLARSIGVFLNGEAIPTVDDRGEPVSDDSFLLLFNAQYEPVDFVLPKDGWGEAWTKVLDTADSVITAEPGPDAVWHCAGEEMALTERSVILLRRAD
ncbi:MAG: glycogen debranching enzyme, partial [Acidimicrobiales bacterium]